MYRHDFIYEFEVPKGKLKEALERLNKPGLTKEYLDECNEIADKYKKPLKKVKCKIGNIRCGNEVEE